MTKANWILDTQGRLVNLERYDLIEVREIRYKDGPPTYRIVASRGWHSSESEVVLFDEDDRNVVDALMFSLTMRMGAHRLE